MTIHLLLADDRALHRLTLRFLLDSCLDTEVVDEAVDGREAIELARVHRPDIVVMDVRMPGEDGLDATREICADPELSGTKVLILTTLEIDEHVARAMRAGASGFLGSDADDLIAAVRTAAAGDALLSPQTTGPLISRFLAAPETDRPLEPSGRVDALTAREREVVALAARGFSNEEIADRLSISPFTARTHIHRAMAKLNARDRAQLVVIAYQTGLVKAPSYW